MAREHPKNMQDLITVGMFQFCRWEWDSLVSELRRDGMLVGLVRAALEEDCSREEVDNHAGDESLLAEALAAYEASCCPADARRSRWRVRRRRRGH